MTYSNRQFGPDVAIHESAFVHETAQIYGKVRIEAEASVWPNAVIRSEIHEVVIGAAANIQDFVMIHVGYHTPTLIGARASITHHATVHGAEIGEAVLIGINAVVMDGAVIGQASIVAGQSIVTEGAVFPENSIIAGAPAKLVKTRDNRAANVENSVFYRWNGIAYAKGVHRMEEW